MDQSKPGRPALHAVPPSQRIVSVDALRGLDMFWIAGGGPLAMAFCKLIWTSSMVLWSGGWCLLLLALFYWVIDVPGHRRWAFPFIVIGMNAIAAYMAPDLINFRWISHTTLGGLARHLGMFGESLVAFGAFGILWVGLYYMYRKQTFVRI